jgi:hypothetical protein
MMGWQACARNPVLVTALLLFQMHSCGAPARLEEKGGWACNLYNML